MLRKLTALIAALMLCACASAEVYSGVTAALSTQAVTTQVGGTLTSAAVPVGARVEAGDALLTLSESRVFAEADGSVSLIAADAGEDVSGTVLEVMPTRRYVIHCTVEKAYQSAESTLVHDGETVYARCTQDGTHRAVGTLCAVDGSSFRVLTLGGALYVGETVYLYRDADFTASQRIGIGTVLENDTVAYAGEGTLTALCVQAGDTVERGQLLYALDGGSVTAPVAGIVTAIDVQPGDSVAKSQAVATIVPDGQVCVQFTVDEAGAARIAAGDAAQLTLASDPDAEPIAGRVIDCAWVAADGAYTVRVLPETDAALPLGLHVDVRLENG